MVEADINKGAGADQGGDVWNELFSTVASLSETVELSLQAMAPDNAPGDKVRVDRVFCACMRLRVQVGLS